MSDFIFSRSPEETISRQKEVYEELIRIWESIGMGSKKKEPTLWDTKENNK